MTHQLDLSIFDKAFKNDKEGRPAYDLAKNHYSKGIEVEQARRTQQSIDTLNQAADKIDDFLENNEPRIGQGKTKKEVKSNITDNESAPHDDE